MYEELVADSLTAYRNAQTELRNGLAKGTENIKFLKAEKKKHIALAKNEVSNEVGGRIYSAQQNYGAAVFDIKSKQNDEVESLRAKGASEEEIKAKVNELTAANSAKIDELKANFKNEKVAIKEDKARLVENSKAKVAEIAEKYDTLIAQARQEYKETKSSLIAKYKPIISSCKKTFEAESKIAKEKVSDYKKQLKAKYLAKVESIKAKSGTTSEKKIKAELEQAKKDYTSSLKITKAEAKAKALEIMKEVGIKDPEKRFNQYPFEFSGGMRQRIVIAIALTANPDILICDEPTTALDVTIQAQILELINKLKKERELSCIFITHDLGVVANMADRVAVMYAGKIVEYGTEEEIFYDPKHPYTWALLSSIPDVDSNEKLDAIPGTPPNMIYPPVGDAFALRSKYAMEIDFKKEPPFFKVSDTHYAATWLLDPRAPKVELPKIVQSRIENSLKANKKGGKK
ncbi:MAG: ATP-binding cassette domain-containing protein [Bacilli bacterium]|nr:ATP-binding cassette domain-containing protein [Bacilli bacterium]